MRTDETPSIRLSDYKAPGHLIDHVDLDVSFHPTATKVVSTLQVRPNPDRPSQPLHLDGEMMELAGVEINGVALTPDAFRKDERSLVIMQPPGQAFTLRITTLINPEANKSLTGFYRSNGNYCTQCEAEGFRRITYYPDRPDVMATFRVRLEANIKEAPVLLSNGNCVESGDAGGDRHYAIWEDPHKKPAYLFAMVGGDLDAIHDAFTTMSGRKVTLGIYVEKGKANRAHYAMDALKRSMRWDETAFGREYDLDVFNIVAVSDFNFGAMENKGLNIFNDKFILADSETATDTDFALIEAIIAHEYFHNWTGNRITCRDWFQLCLKEGLTVFRDQEFTSDMRSRPVKRIADVRQLRSTQFVEDQGPLAHNVRPIEYKEINNFYTTTIYEKGAEVIRMLKTLIGADAFAKGMDLYFSRHDGDATTIEAFIACFAEAAKRDLSHFMRWYDQAGTPRLHMTHANEGHDLALNFSQVTPPTPGQASKLAQVLPIRLGAITPSGEALALNSAAISNHDLFIFDQAHATLVIKGAAGAIPSILREFSAPVEFTHDLSIDEIGHLARHDSDPFNRWQAVQDLAMTVLMTCGRDGSDPALHDVTPVLTAAMKNALALAENDPAFVALVLALPSEGDVARNLKENVDPSRVHAARKGLRRSIGGALCDELLERRAAMTVPAPYDPGAQQAQRRQFRAAALDLAAAGHVAKGLAVAEAAFRAADNMTDKMAALTTLAQVPGTAREAALKEFEQRYASNPLVMDKWFAINASLPESSTLQRVKDLMSHQAYSSQNPNRARALIGSYALMNPSQFHRADGEGYNFLADMLLAFDAFNPQLAGRVATAFRTWRSMEPGRRAHAEKALLRIQSAKVLSSDLKDIIDRTLG
jgi:aminopeptidase N